MKTDEADKLTQALFDLTRKPRQVFPAYFLIFPILHLLIALPLAYYLNIWSDEASSLFTTEQGFFGALNNTLQNEKQAPLYFLILSVWREISSSIFFARLLSIIFSLLSIALFYDLVRRIWNENTAILATFFFALHPYMLWASLEIRVYSLVILLTLVLIKLFFRGYLERRKVDPEGQIGIGKSQLLFVAAAVFALYANYYTGFLLLGFFAVLVVLNRRAEIKLYIVHMLVVGLAISPLLWSIKQQFDVNTGGHFQQTDWITGIKILWNHFLSFSLPTEIYAPEEQSWVSFIRIWVVRIFWLGVAFVLVLRKRLLKSRIIIFATVAAVSAVCFYVAYFLVSEIYVEVRHASVLFVPVCFLLIAVFVEFLKGVSKPGQSRWFYWTAVAAIVLTFFYSYALYSLYPNLTKRGDWARVSQFIEKNEKPGQAIIVFTNYEAITLPYYYRGSNEILPKENFFKWNFEAEFGEEGTWSSQIEYIISIIPKDAREIWLVSEEGCQTTKGCVPLEKYLDANYTIVKERDFYKERVRLLRKK